MQFFQGIFSHLPVLETDRLILRSMRMSDARDLYAYASDPQVSQTVLWDAHQSIFQSRRFLRAAIWQYRRGLPASFAITLRDSGRMIGTIGFMWVNTDHKSAEVGYSLSRAYWNQGYMTEALRAVIDYSFQTLGIHRIGAQHETDNEASGAVMRKCGMQKEGTLRGRLYNKGKYVDVNVYAILREDYNRDRRLKIGKQ